MASNTVEENPAETAVSAATSRDRFLVTKATDTPAADDCQAAHSSSQTENGGIPLANVRKKDSSTKTVIFSDKMDLFEGSATDSTVQQYLEDMEDPNHGQEDGAVPKEKANLGVIMGVFFPCIQNIFGVIYFVRLYWIVGEAGAVEAFLIVFSCCCVSVLTSLSISAIATNGRVTGGGTYILISRSLGPEFGGAVGILFYIGISVSVAMYLAGSIELLLVYIAPDMKFHTDKYNNARVYGTLLLLIVAATVFTGVKFVSRVALVVLSSVLVAILSVYVGIFASTPDSSPKVCFLGDRLLWSEKLMENGSLQCNKAPGSPLYRIMCNNGTDCDPYFSSHQVHLRPAVTGIRASTFKENAFNHYGDEGTLVNEYAKPPVEDIFVERDITTSFVILLAIYCPSITGFEQGSSFSGDLADAQKAIPQGTLWAVGVTSTVYLSTVLLFGATVEGSVLRDKFGCSINNELVMSQLSWPSPWVILVGALMSTVGAGLQALAAAPRLLQAIAKDNVFPILHHFKYMTNKGEPIPAIAMSVAIAEVGILIARLDYVAPIVTMFFLLCYGFVNFACCLQSLLRSPHWRPRFRFYHWCSALLGVALCLTLMVLSSWYYTLIALSLACSAYKYVEYKGAEKEWGDGMRGLSMSAAMYALLRLKQDASEGSTKNWRPQLLVLVKLDHNLEVLQPRVLSLASQLKAGHGLTIVSSVIQGDFFEMVEDSKHARLKLMASMEREQVKGFANVVVSDGIQEGLCHVFQSTGLGALYPNTVMLCWPDHWFDSTNRETYRVFMNTLHYGQASNMALQVVKGATVFPDNSARLEGTIDIWWIMHDGSMLIMLAFLLVQHKVWKNCSLRLFTVAQLEDNSVQMKKDLKQYMYNLRIPATVEVVEMEDRDISAYIYERTLKMEQRVRLLSAMNLKRKESAKVVDVLVDRAHKANQPALNVKSDTPLGSTEQVVIEMDKQQTNGTTANTGEDISPVYYSFSPEPQRSDTPDTANNTNVQDMFDDVDEKRPLIQSATEAAAPGGKGPAAVTPQDSKPSGHTPEGKGAVSTSGSVPTAGAPGSKVPAASPKDPQPTVAAAPKGGTPVAAPDSKPPVPGEGSKSATGAPGSKPPAPGEGSKSATGAPGSKPPVPGEGSKSATGAPGSKPPVPGEGSKSATGAPGSKSATGAPGSKGGAGAPGSKSEAGAPGSKGAGGLGTAAKEKSDVTDPPTFSEPTEDDSFYLARAKNMRKMHTAVRLNEKLRERSANADLIILNMPTIPENPLSQANYMHFMEILVEGLDKVLMIRGTGREVITMYN
ncbi:solute carrier family 12 member 4-like [Babylonia areolata]|uniref:solute carrier family 12 member 4-like n=1 Tax=Babylonia areolata TaxID=304850 RepID=UPI003FD43074